MITKSTLILAIVFLAVFAGCMLLAQAVSTVKARRRVRALATEDASPASPAAAEWVAQVVRMSGPLARLSAPEQQEKISALRSRFMQAGYRSEHAPTIYFALKVVLAVALPVLAWLSFTLAGASLKTTGLLVAIAAAAAVGYVLPNLFLKLAIARRQREIFENLPNALDLMTVCVEAGLNTDMAIGRIAAEMTSASPVLSSELHLTTLELRAGSSKEMALRNLALRSGVGEVDSLVTMLIQAEQFGTSIADSLRVHADHLRTKRRQQAEERAAKIALKLLMPLIFCIFPALILIMVGPSFIQITRVLMPSLGAQ
ncbi:type II secretion system F family protein [Noviherbaspirillum aerium]|uniref:type II secretion system F family protein n=1 Tax=Noviherbaspirillum aerium TaxID=2588497 RepID=UPI00124DBF50|nr:type II secretion system F family protein [Noviherbaspirillum aerium]